VPNVRITSTALLTNKTPSGTYRAPGRCEGSFFCERIIELAARDLGIDSAEMRRRNLIGAGEMPYRLPRLEPGGPAVDTECDSGDYRETLERCLAEFGWEEKCALQGREIDGRYHGVAVACFIEGGGAGPKETARLDLEADGTVSVYVGSAAVGQGLVLGFSSEGPVRIDRKPPISFGSTRLRHYTERRTRVFKVSTENRLVARCPPVI
jgi:carbon-monoxide dehydrogenase large subunit